MFFFLAICTLWDRPAPHSRSLLHWFARLRPLAASALVVSKAHACKLSDVSASRPQGPSLGQASILVQVRLFRMVARQAW